MPGIQLQPVPYPIGFFQQYISKRTETLILKGKMLSFSGDSFNICFTNGQPLLYVRGKRFSITGRKKVVDVDNKYLFDIFKEYFHLHPTYVIENQDQGKIMEVKSSWTLFSSKATAKITSSDGKHDFLIMRGRFFSSDAKIVDEASEVVVALIERNLTARLLVDKQTYTLTVAPGVDMALMAALCICLDEKKNDKS